MDYFRNYSMDHMIRFCFIWLLLNVFGLSASAGVNYSELRAIINSEEATLTQRLEALEQYSNEIPSGGAEEFTLLTEQFWSLELSPDQWANLAYLKAKGLIASRKPSSALALIDSVLRSEESRNFSDASMHRLYYQRGRSQNRILDAENGWTKSMADFEQSLEFAESMGDINAQVVVHDALGLVHNHFNDKQTAADHYYFILKYSDDEGQRAQARYNIALQYANNRLTRDTALAYMLEARTMWEQASNQEKVGASTVSIANAYRNDERYAEAIQEYNTALGKGLKTAQRVTCYEYLGYIATEQGRLDDATAYFKQALKFDADQKNKRKVYISTKLGMNYLKQGKTSAGLALCDSMLSLVLNDDNFSNYARATRLTDCYDCLHHAHFNLEMYRDAQVFRDRRDSAENAYKMVTEDKAAQLNLELFEYEELREEEKRRVMNKQKDDQRTLLVVIVLLLIIFAIFITSRYRFTRKQSQLISTQRQQLQDRQKELIRANAELEIALNHKAVFLSNMSHEIRTPLNAIVGMSNLASKENMADVAKKYLRNIVTASSNLIDIVNDILDFSKLEAGKLEIAQEPFSVADALEVAENVMRIPAEQKGLHFEVQASDSLPSHLLGDASRLNQVLINLVGNAIKFTLDGGVTMSAEVGPLPPLPKWCPAPSVSHQEWFVVRVTDTGIGIPEDKLEKIFESFNQGDQLKTRKFGGTGLGLSISKQIVELQGGIIWVESVDGEGSTFAFALPALASAVADSVEEEVIEEVEIGALRILIAEDNPFNVIVTEDTLRSELKDVEIGKAENGRIAFEKVRDEEWDLVLMDIHMPEMSGLEATTAIRKLSNSKSETLIVAMTASVLREETDSYIRHGMNGFVPKPFQVAQLLSEIRRLKNDKQKVQKSAPTFPALRILIAEDNPFNVIVAEDTLRSELPDVTIGKAVNGREAFEAVRDGDWDLVLMDIAMPEMTGLEATSAIRKLPQADKASTTIIAMTASVLKEETDHYIQKGMDGFVPKPFKVEQLLGEIQRAHISRS